MKITDIENIIINDIQNINSKWYKNSRKLIKILAKKYNVEEKTICGILAITSIRNTLKRNLELTINVLNDLNNLYQSNPNLNFIDNLKTMNMIKKQLKNFLQYGKINGVKITAFYHNLNGNDYEITIDIWIYRYFINRFNIKNRNKIKIIIANLSKKLNCKPAKLQEKIWIKSKQLYGRNIRDKNYNDYLKIYEKEFMYGGNINEN